MIQKFLHNLYITKQTTTTTKTNTMSSKTAETCKFCKKVVVIDPVKEDVDGVYMIANCDSFYAMTCRECLTTDNEGQCKGCYDDETYPCACCDKEMTLDETNTVDEYDGWVCDACREELSSDDDDEWVTYNKFLAMLFK